MKLLRYGQPGKEKPALLDNSNQLRDLSTVILDVGGEALTSNSLKLVTALDPSSLPLVSGHHRIGPCIARPGKFICIGLNYSDTPPNPA